MIKPLTQDTPLLRITREANELLNKHGLTDTSLIGSPAWRFEFSNHKTIMGQCRHTHRIIHLSSYFVTSPPEEITNTLLHEIAHALAGPGHHHDHTWKRIARSIGCSGDRCYERHLVNNHATPAYILECPITNCTYELPRYRQRRRNARTYYICPTHRVRLIQKETE